MTARRAGLAWPLAAALLAALAPAAVAQLPRLEPLPFAAPADSSSRLALTAEVQHAFDGGTGWQAHGLALAVDLPAGAGGRFFLRVPYLFLDTDRTPVGARWPGVLGAAADPGWPGEAQVAGLGQVEVGAVGPLRAPLLGSLQAGAALGVPVGANRLYPFASAGMPLRLAVREERGLGAALAAGLEAGIISHFDAGGEELDPAAFPGGRAFAATLDLRGRSGRRVGLRWEYDEREGRTARRVGAQWWLPWTAAGAVGLRATRELGGEAQRPAAWYVSVAWRFDSLRHRAGREQAPAASR